MYFVNPAHVKQITVEQLAVSKGLGSRERVFAKGEGYTALQAHEYAEGLSTTLFYPSIHEFPRRGLLGNYYSGLCINP